MNPITIQAIHKTPDCQINKKIPNFNGIRNFEACDDFKISEDRLGNILNNLEIKIKDSPKENGFIIDPKSGEVISEFSGNENKIVIQKEGEVFKMPVGMVFTHNHPDNDDNQPGLSTNDISSAITFKLSEIRAVSGNYVHSIKMPAILLSKDVRPSEIIKKAGLGCNGNLSKESVSGKSRTKPFSLSERAALKLKDIQASINPEEALKIIENAYENCLSIEMLKILDASGEEDAVMKAMRNNDFWGNVYERFTKIIPGSSYKIEGLDNH